jgi:cold shock CspA family protein/restriction endonuclease Mrr
MGAKQLYLADKGFGFIKAEGVKKEVFFNSDELTNVQFSDLRQGDKLGFDIVLKKGLLIAVNVGKNGYVYDEDALDSTDSDAHSDVYVAVKMVSNRLAEIIAKNPSALNYLEWRDVERVVAMTFAGLGFSVELTSGSKDGGKDVIVAYIVSKGPRSHFVEVKHWKTRVGSPQVSAFLHLIARENRDTGLMIATHGFANKAIERLTEVERKVIRFGTRDKIVSLCRNYVRANEGVWYPPAELDDAIFEDTI